MGASRTDINRQLFFDIFFAVLIAFVIATPITWYLMNRWLQSFVYRQEMTVGIYLLAGLTVVLITLFTVSWHSYKAASANPVKALRSE